MIVVRVEMWPGGDKTKAKEFARAVITNKAETTLETSGKLGDYSVVLKGGVWGALNDLDGRPWRCGSVEGFDRVGRGMWDLLFVALSKIVGYRNK